MLLGLQGKEQKNSAEDKKESMVPQPDCADQTWMETFDDEISAGSTQCMGHSERCEFVKNRTYSKIRQG